MKKTVLIMRMFFLGLLFISAVACSSDDDGDNGNGGEDQQNIVEIALETPELTSLVAALQAADGDLVNLLQGDGPFTVLAPNNAAFAAFLAANGFDSLDDVPTDVLEAVLLNHVIQADVTSGDLTALGKGYTSTSATGAGDLPISIYFNTESGVRFNNISAVTSGGADIDASNGTIHIVDAVIPIPNIVDHAVANSDFSSLVAALGAADGNLIDVLNGEGPFTVLAPDNDAFTTFLDGADLGGINKTALTRTLLNHVLDGSVNSTALTGAGAGYVNSSVNGPGDNPMSLYFNTSEGVRFNGISSVSTADVVGSNGIIHAVDAVIALPTVVTFAAADPNFSTLAGALDARGFIPILSRTEGDNLDNYNPEFTVFAPTNEAFDALESIPEGSALDNVLLHHVVGEANLASSALAEGENVATSLQGQNLTVTVIGSPFEVTDGSGNDVIISAFDIQADNGVIHVVENVLIPSAE